MPDSRRPQAERRLQHPFSKSSFFSGLLVAGVVLAVHYRFSGLPDRTIQADATAEVRLDPVVLRRGSGAALGVLGAWRLASNEPRFGGLSALAVDGDALVALTDSGVVVKLLKPRSRRMLATFHDLPDGPGDPRHKSRRDSEALGRLSSGDWLVAFENRDQLWRYDAQFQSGRVALDFIVQNWPRNRGIEAMAVDRRDHLLLVPEAGETLVVVRGGAEYVPIESGGWTVSDATLTPDGQRFVLLRRITITGFRNAIGEISETAGHWRVTLLATLPIGGLDNAEGLAAEQLPSGGTRLWIVTDNDSAWYRRTPLVKLDLPARQRPI